MQREGKRYVDSKGVVTRPVYAQLEISVWELLKEMKYKREQTYSELISEAIITTYSAESDTYPMSSDDASTKGETDI